MPRITKDNFHVETFGVFTRCKTPTREPDFKSIFSRYWYDDNILIRQSDHWCHKIRSCAWVLNLGQDKQGELITAMAKFEDMSPMHSKECHLSFKKRKRYKKRIKADRLKLAA